MLQGVLQFVSTFVRFVFQYINVNGKPGRVKCLGYTSNTFNFIKHWSQFADDTAIITAFEHDNQYLLNLFTKWCSWSDLIVKIRKCVTFGIKKSSTAAVQFEPHLMISCQKIPTVRKGESFKYLGKSFNFRMNLHQIKEELESKF